MRPFDSWKRLTSILTELWKSLLHEVRTLNIDGLLPAERYEALTHLGENYYQSGDAQAALEHFDRALEIAPQFARAIWGKSLALLSLGDFEEGWVLYDIGLGFPSMRGFVPFPDLKLWDGETNPDMHLLLCWEQGLGDAIQFIRYAEHCRARVGKLSVLCPAPLSRLFKSITFIEDFFEVLPAHHDFDAHIPLMSLPRIFHTVMGTIPADVPYLKVEHGLDAQWAARFKNIPQLKVGIAWAGNPAIGNIDRQRSIDLRFLTHLFWVADVRFFNLQKGEARKQLTQLDMSADEIIDFMGEVSDFADTAAIVQNLDLIITVDTAVAHLAGALAKPVWMLSRHGADWRWLNNKPTNPWYPTMRVFGQPAKGDWQSVVAVVHDELANLASLKSGKIAPRVRA